MSPARLFSPARKWLLRLALAGCMLGLTAAPASAAITFDATPTGGSPAPAAIEMVQDTGTPALNAQYVGIRFSSSVALSNVYARAIVSGAGYLLDAEEAQDHFVGDLSSTAKVGYWFINHPSSGNGGFQLQIYVGDPANGGVLQATSSTYVLRSANADNSASANKILSISLNGGSPIELGQTFNAVVCYSVNSTARLLVQPAVSSNFNPNHLRLGNSITSLYGSSDCSGTATATLSNQLMFDGSNSANSVRATYTFQTIGAAAVALSPLVNARSGIYKYNADFATFPGSTVPAPANRVLLAKTVNVAESSGAVTVTYTLTATNTGTSTTYLDEFVDTLPSTPTGASYVAGSSKLNGVAFANPVISGQSLSWKDPAGKPGGQFIVPAGGTLTLAFQVNVPATNGTFTNNAIARIGTVQIDSTLATSDSAPATATTRVGPPVLSVTKTADTPTVVNGASGSVARYTIKVANTGTAAAGVKLSDAGLPAGFAYLSTVAVNTPAGGTCTTAATRTSTIDPTPGAAAPSWGDFSIPGGCEVSVQFDAGVASTVADGVYSSSANTSTSTLPATINNFDGAPPGTTADDVTVTSAVLAVSKTTSTPNVSIGGTATYSITVANSGTAAATGVKLTDTLAAGFAYTNTTSVSVNGTVLAAAGYTSGGTAAAPSWDTNPGAGFTINPGQALAIVFNASAPATSGTYNNDASATSTNAKSIGQFSGTSTSAEDVTVGIVVGVSLYGTVYADANHNAQRDGGEAGTGLTLFAKLVPAGSPTGPAIQAATVQASTGAFSFSGVPAGPYLIVLDDSATLADVTANAPAGWLGTEMPDGMRRNVVVTGVDVQGQNFGLFNGSKLSGRVFNDNGAGAGTPNNGVPDGAEAGIAGAGVRATDASGAITHDSTLTIGAGDYTLWVPASAAGATVRVVQTNLGGYVSVSGAPGSTGGAYLRASDSVSFSNSAGTTYSGVNFGDVAENTLVGVGRQNSAPGSVVFYAHTFTAGSGGSVSFNLASLASPGAIGGFTQALFHDSNCNGQLDAAEPALALNTGVVVQAGVPLCLIVKESVPGGAPIGATDTVTLSAAFTYTNAGPPLQANATNTDVTTVGAGSALRLVKTQSTATPLPGSTITYTIAYTNSGATPLAAIRLHDTTPAHTRFVSAACGVPLPAGISACSVSLQPAAAGSGSLEWALSGSLAPAAGGQVTFSVQVEN